LRGFSRDIEKPPIVNFINILRAALVPCSFAKKLQSLTVIRKKIHKTLLYVKGAHKLLMKVTQGCREEVHGMPPNIGFSFLNIFYCLGYTTKNSSFSNNLSNFNDVAGRTNTSGGPRV